MKYTEIDLSWRFNCGSSYKPEGYYWIEFRNNKYYIHWSLTGSSEYSKERILGYINNNSWELVILNYEIF